MPSEATALCRNTSVPTTIRFIAFINGKPTCESWMYPRSRPCLTSPCPIHLWSGWWAPSDASVWTLRCSGRPQILKGSYSISKSILISIARIPDGWGDHRTRRCLGQWRTSNFIDGNLIAGACIKHRSLLDSPMDSGRCRMAVNGTGTFQILFLESAALVRQPARPPLPTHCVLSFLSSGQSGTPSV
jgi:hypothetical protein